MTKLSIVSLRALLLSVLFLAGDGLAAASSEKPATGPRPNIILIMADDLGWGDPGFMGNKVIKTPALDRMAKDGLVMRRFYAAAPVCSPTRASCLTGRHPNRMGIFFANVGHLPAREVTLQQLLQSAGYLTGHFGKWHLGTLTKTLRDANRGGPRGAKHFAPPWQRAFDDCFSTESKVPTWNPMLKPNTNKFYGTHYWHHNGKPADTKDKSLQGDDSRVIMDRALPFIKHAADKKQPFFSVIWFHTPHLPVVGGPGYLEQYKDVKNAEARHYYACITAMDEQIGRLRAELKKLGIDENTLIFFCSDNGPEGQAGRAPGSAGFLRGRKRSLYEGGIRVPGIALWPGTIEPGGSTDVPACTSDYLPTIVDLLKLKMPDDRSVDGVNILPLLRGNMKQRPRPIAFASRAQLALVDNQFSLYSANGKRWELYDLIADPGQQTDLAPQQPMRVQQMRQALQSWQNSVQKDWPAK